MRILLAHYRLYQLLVGWPKQTVDKNRIILPILYQIVCKVYARIVNLKKIIAFITLNVCWKISDSTLEITGTDLHLGVASFADPRCFIPDTVSTIFSSRVRIQTFFHPGSWILLKKLNANFLFSCFLCFPEQSLSLSHDQKGPGSRKNSSEIRIPDFGSMG
jgi:hypothetical protein